MIKPLPGYLLIEPMEEDSVSAGGVYVTETSKDKSMKGKVIEISTFFPSSYQDWIALGDSSTHTGVPTLAREYGSLVKDSIVIYKKWTNQEVQHEGKTYLLVHFNELLGVIK